MSGFTDKTSPPAALNQAVSENRRRLLKAAAFGAPMIATLKSGAAAATASARQCITNDAAAPDPQGILTPDDDLTLLDQYIYQEGQQYTVYDGDGVASIYYLVQNKWYNGTGSPIISSPLGTLPVCETDKSGCYDSEVRYFLALWKPDDPSYPTTVTSQCVVPVNSLTDYQALSKSCWASVDPGVVAC